MAKDVLIIGAGLAGLSCAWRAQEAGFRVSVMEARPVVGGRTSSWRQDGWTVDSGIHKFYGVYRELPRLLEDAGIVLEDVVHWRDTVAVRLPDGAGSAVFRTAPSRRTLDTLAGLAGNNRFISPLDKLSLARFIRSGLRDYRDRPETLDSTDVLSYARSVGLRERAIERVLSALTAGILFLPPHRVSAFPFMGFVAPYVGRWKTLRLGAFQGGMTEVMAAPLASAIEKRGGRVAAGAGVERLLWENDRVVGAVCGGTPIRADVTVLAVGLGAVKQLLGPMRPDLDALPTMSVAAANIELSEPSMSEDQMTFSPGTCLGFYSEQSRTTYRGSSGRLSILLAPSDDMAALTPEEVRLSIERDGARLGLKVAGAIRRFHLHRKINDFYRYDPGAEALRPPQDIGIPGLRLAGDYTRQPYHSSMEGAVLSGRLAAESIKSSSAA
jgi:15-cis-phytoene desaturase